MCHKAIINTAGQLFKAIFGTRQASVIGERERERDNRERERGTQDNVNRFNCVEHCDLQREADNSSNNNKQHDLSTKSAREIATKWVCSA